jgi:hypothetical protein
LIAHVRTIIYILPLEMRSSLLLAVLALVVMTVAVVAQDKPATPTACHPQCRWQCDDPSCPAQCHPVCERPKCQVHCEETPCAACKIHCDKPQCNVRCPKDLCESTDCPKCETVCAPAKCRTACTAPNAVCTPMCEETKCDWKCKKPTLCPRPKCELVCEQPACAFKKPVAAPAANNTCCQCNQANIAASMIQANEAATEELAAETPSFLELTHHFKFQAQESGSAPCCACGAQ